MSDFRVLIVDDEPAICQAFSALLERHGFDVETVSSRDEAHACLTTDRVDALVLDLRLRDSAPGDEIFREAVLRDPSLHERTLFITGDISTEARDRIVACGCPYLMKPFDAQLLIDAVAALCGAVADVPASVPAARQVRRPIVAA